MNQLGDDLSDRRILLSIDDEANGTKAARNGILDPNENMTVQQFFHNLTKIFKNINFYNLLDITHEQANKDSDIPGNDDQ